MASMRHAVWMDGQSNRAVMGRTAPAGVPSLPSENEKRRNIEAWKALLDGRPVPKDPAAPPRRREAPPKPAPPPPPGTAEKGTQDERKRVIKAPGVEEGAYVCRRCGAVVTGGERQALAHWVSRCLKGLGRQHPPPLPIEGRFPPVSVKNPAASGRHEQRTVSTQETLNPQLAYTGGRRRWVDAPAAFVPPAAGGSCGASDDFAVHHFAADPQWASAASSSLSGASSDEDVAEATRMSDLCHELAEADAQLHSLLAHVSSALDIDAGALAHGTRAECLSQLDALMHHFHPHDRRAPPRPSRWACEAPPQDKVPVEFPAVPSPPGTSAFEAPLRRTLPCGVLDAGGGGSGTRSPPTEVRPDPDVEGCREGEELSAAPDPREQSAPLPTAFTRLAAGTLTAAARGYAARRRVSDLHRSAPARPVWQWKPSPLRAAAARGLQRCGRGGRARRALQSEAVQRPGFDPLASMTMFSCDSAAAEESWRSRSPGAASQNGASGASRSAAWRGDEVDSPHVATPASPSAPGHYPQHARTAAAPVPVDVPGEAPLDYAMMMFGPAPGLAAAAPLLDQYDMLSGPSWSALEEGAAEPLPVVPPPILPPRPHGGEAAGERYTEEEDEEGAVRPAPEDVHHNVPTGGGPETPPEVALPGALRELLGGLGPPVVWLPFVLCLQRAGRRHNQNVRLAESRAAAPAGADRKRKRVVVKKKVIVRRAAAAPSGGADLPGEGAGAPASIEF
eukprot:TRINITY_DN22138_c0_g1_i1.p1 TRINITY_DN22138_c0_g1~~TRINITY_DN22138_c0_g1_i1.p1  ORF type:complete len:734 (+),score=163.35 TRINITY_DN22138_c0_g1_i1:57-2258(+)